MPVEVIYRRNPRSAEPRVRDGLDNLPTGIPSQVHVTENSTRTTTTVYEQGFQTHPNKPSLLNQ